MGRGVGSFAVRAATVCALAASLALAACGGSRGSDAAEDDSDHQVFAADGRAYTMALDLGAGRYSLGGDGVSDLRELVPDGEGGWIVGAGPERLRSAEGLVVGVHQVGDTLLPYVAAQTFLASTTGAAGRYNLMIRRVAADGSDASTHPATATLSGNTLQICENDYEVVYTSACASGSLRSYTVSVADSVFTATPTVAGTPPIRFRIARAGQTELLLSVGESTLGDGRLQWLVALKEEFAGFFPGRFVGPGVLGGDADWLAITMDADAGTYTALGGAFEDQAVLTSLNGQQPPSMFHGELNTQHPGSPVWVLQNYPLLIVGGAPLVPEGVTNLSGLLQIALP
ncbi:hypothetical protein [Rubrivivax benzoatilyticus]|uniref:hypothetical protein n=1 Tax=Rubrivivax benzoatilyticus TaxID=316997 RepID=UPI001110312F|nr:hypothetical protein [Rubrivivax benzoatilyticus]